MHSGDSCTLIGKGREEGALGQRGDEAVDRGSGQLRKLLKRTVEGTTHRMMGGLGLEALHATTRMVGIQP